MFRELKIKRKYFAYILVIILIFEITVNPVSSENIHKIIKKKELQNNNLFIRSPAEYEPVNNLLLIWPKWRSPSDGIIQINYFIELIKYSEDIINITLFVDNLIIKQRVINTLKENKIFLDNITIINHFTNSIWVRDYGPFFIKENGKISVVDFYFHGYTIFPDIMDNFFPFFYSLKNKLKYRSFSSLFLGIQGGNFMCDDNGTGFVGDRIFYQDNPKKSKDLIIENLKNNLGLKNLIILKSQNLSIKNGGDGTGHIDMFTKILNQTTILVGQYNDTNDSNYQTLEYNAELLNNLGYNVVRIPMLRDPKNNMFIWTYTNSLIINNGEEKVVLLPLYNIPEDQIAISIYEENMPDYQIRGINCTTIIKSLGAIHCTTITVPLI